MNGCFMGDPYLPSGMTLEEYKKYLGDENLTEEQLKEHYFAEKQKYDSEVAKVAGNYDRLNMDDFIKRIGGYEKIESMNKINEKLDRSDLVNGKLVPKKSKTEDLNEWKKGFMDGFEEAYKRLQKQQQS